MRLIDADALEYHKQLECMGNGQYEDVKVVYEWDIDNAPTIEAEWISASERLPNEEGLYMVTLKTFSDDYRFIDLLHYGKPMMPNCRVKGACWYRNDSEWGDVVYDNSDIIAWMPLPMLYRKE